MYRMIHKSTSFPNNLYKLTNSVKKSSSFHDFNTLRMRGHIKYSSYGMFLFKHPNATRSERIYAIQQFYCNKI